MTRRSRIAAFGSAAVLVVTQTCYPLGTPEASGPGVLPAGNGAGPGDRRIHVGSTQKPPNLPSLFESLDFVYLPSRDVAGDLEHFTAVLGGSLIFAIEAFGTRVAMVELAESSPPLLLAGHLEGDQPVLVYRVVDLEQTITELTERGMEPLLRFGIPHGPGVELMTPGPQRIALYQLTRPEAPSRLAGRRDF